MATILSVNFKRSDAFRRAEVARTGNLPDENGKVEFDLAQLTPEQRTQIVDYCGLNFNVRIETFYVPDYRHEILSNGILLDAEPTLDNVLAHLARMTADKATVKAALDAHMTEHAREDVLGKIERLQSALEEHRPDAVGSVLDDKYAKSLDIYPAYRALYAKYTTLEPEFKAEKKAREEQAEADKVAKAQAEREAHLAWAREHGSDRLRRGMEIGHSCDRLYWIERAALEYPEFILDYDGEHDSKNRACPTIYELDKRDAVLAAHPGVKAEIVWLTSAPQDTKPVSDDDYDDEPFQECPALIVDDPTYKHYLVKAL